ncbi:MAG: L,D-transpeptidase [Hyphomicrobiales bacterium]|nr:L,D-transpeptidase [Hyphomicrobiales bacterium]
MRLIFLVLLAAFLVLAAPTEKAQAAVTAEIDLSDQVMHVYVNGRKKHSWPVSTARRGYRTPTGTYSIKRMHKMWHSRRYNMSPMPHSLFFHGGYAVHGTTEVKNLGRPASHGCVRLHPKNAARLYGLVQRHGPGNSRIKIRR